MNNNFLAINKLLTIKADAIKHINNARKMRDTAENIRWNLSDIEERSERHDAFLKSDALYEKSSNENALYELVKIACDDAIMRYAHNAIIEDMKANADAWCKYPIHYKKFNDMVDTFFNPFRKTYSNGATSNFKVTIDYRRVELCNYALCEHNHNTRQLIYKDASGERLTVEDIEKMTLCDVIAPADIVKTCKKSIKDAEKMRKIYADAYAKINAIRAEYNANSAIYFSMPSMSYSMNK